MLSRPLPFARHGSGASISHDCGHFVTNRQETSRNENTQVGQSTNPVVEEVTCSNAQPLSANNNGYGLTKLEMEGFAEIEIEKAHYT